jgi:uncharacterized protein
MMTKAFDQILEHVMSLDIIDTHEHLPFKEEARERETDVLREYLQHYFSRDLISAGLSLADYQAVRDHARSLTERWDLVEPYWNAARHTGYGRALAIAARDLYGVPRIERSTISRLDDEFQKSLAPGHFNRVLKEKSKIRISILDSNLDCDRTYFRSACNIGGFVFPRNLNDVNRIAAEAGVVVSGFDDWLDACRTAAERAREKGAVCFKDSLAYLRSLSYARVSRAAAEEAFNDFFTAIHYPEGDTLGTIPGKPLQDFMMHWLLAEANRKGWVWQVHTGLLEGSGNLLTDADPMRLTNLFIEYPNVRFDLFHIGYPWQQQLSALAKMFPNVTIDMCWAHIISPTASINALCEYVDSVPLNKISAFGGDYCFIDGVYGHQCIARHNVSVSLARKVDEGAFGIDEAKQAAEMLFVGNPRSLFTLP